MRGAKVFALAKRSRIPSREGCEAKMKDKIYDEETIA
jgi:hypothetical protein